MAWCPKCDGNYQIVVSVEGSSYGVPVTTERYSSEGKYIGYEESETYKFDTEALPRCSNCYSVFELPNATSKEEYFYAKREQLIQRKRKNLTAPSSPLNRWYDFIGLFIITGIFVGVIFVPVVLIIEEFLPHHPVADAVIVVLGIVITITWTKSSIQESIQESKRTHERFKKERQEIDEIEAMEYSDENYERLKNPVKRPLSEKESEVLSVFREKRPMEKYHQWKNKKKK